MPKGLYVYFVATTPSGSQPWESSPHHLFSPVVHLRVLKERLWQHLLHRVGFDPALSLVDSFSVPVCRFAGTHRCHRLAQESAFGYDEMNEQTFYRRIIPPGARRLALRFRHGGDLQRFATFLSHIALCRCMYPEDLRKR